MIFLLHCYLYILPLIQKVFECCLLLYAGILFVINIIVKHFLYSFHIVDAKSCVHIRVECFAFNQNMPKDIFVKDKNEMKFDLKSFYFYENI